MVPSAERRTGSAVRRKTWTLSRSLMLMIIIIIIIMHSATALMIAAENLLAAGETSYVKEYLWTGDSSKYNGGAIKFDLDYVISDYASNTCDLWEEIRDADLFWNRATMKKAMILGAAFASKMGSATAPLPPHCSITVTLIPHPHLCSLLATRAARATTARRCRRSTAPSTRRTTTAASSRSAPVAPETPQSSSGSTMPTTRSTA